MSKVYCRYCGKQIDEDAAFCTHCGKEQKVHKTSFEIVEITKNKSKTIGKKALALIQVFYDYVRTIKIPRMSKEKAVVWRNRIKKLGKIALFISVIALIVSAGIGGYMYYYEEYLPKKLLDEACADILSKMRSNDKTISVKYSLMILGNNTEWGYEKVDDYRITAEMLQHQNEAFKKLETEAYNGNAYAQERLGCAYYFDGDGVDNDIKKAVYWWNEAAKQEYAKAYVRMGTAYENGKGVRQDMRKAIEYYKKGAEKGESYAQAHYGRMFRDGVKVKVGSHKETKRHTGYGWSGNGEKIRQYYDYDLMDFITITKEDVDDYEILIPQDIEQAKYWWQKSAAQGNEYAKGLLQQVYE